MNRPSDRIAFVGIAAILIGLGSLTAYFDLPSSVLHRTARAQAPIPIQTAGARPAGVATVDIRDTYATVPGASTDVGIAIQAAIDALPPGQPGRVLIPSGQYAQRTPVWLDRNQTEIAGESRQSTRITMWDYAPSIMVRRRHPYDATHRVDGFGILDANCCPLPGQRWGLTLGTGTTADHFLMVQSYPPATGKNDQWYTVPGLTLGFKLGGIPTGGPIMGMGDLQGPSPWYLEHYWEPSVGHRMFRFSFRTTEGVRSKDDSPRIFTFGNVDAIRGPPDVTIQIRFDQANTSPPLPGASPDQPNLCSIRAWVGGVEQVITLGYGTRLISGAATQVEPSFAPTDGLHWRRNKLMAFHVGNGTPYDTTWQAAPADRGMFALYGCYIGHDAPFGSDATGQQVRLDGGILDDNFRYLGVGRDASALVARLSLDQPPAADEAGRLVRFTSGSWNGNISAMGLMQSEGTGAVENVGFKDFAILCQQQGGSGIAMGPILNASYDGIGISGGLHGIIGDNTIASYDHTFKNNCSIQGSDAWMQFTQSIVSIDRLARAYVGNTGLRFSGCDVDCGPLRTGGYTNHPSSTVEILDTFAYAARYSFSKISSDQENGSAEPALVCQKHKTGGTFLSVFDVDPGLRDATTPAILLIDRFPTGGTGGIGPGIYRVGGISAGTGPAVQASGDWKAEGTP